MMLRQRRMIRLLMGLGLGLLLGLMAAAFATQIHSDQSSMAPGSAASTVHPLGEKGVEPVKEPPRYEVTQLSHSLIHTVTVSDPQQYPVQIAVGEGLTRVDALAQQQGALAALNAGFFDPNNGLTTSYVTVEGELVADPQQNQRLVGNPDLTAYLDQILNRSEFRRYDCGGTVQYDIALHQAAPPTGCSLVSAVGAGPQLLPQDTSYEEAFIDYGAEGVINRDALGSQSRNARSAIGIKPDGSLVLVMAAQRPGISPSGLTFAELTEFLQSVGVEKALNLDGGSSSTLFFQGTTHYGRLDREGNWVRRPVKSIVFIGPG
ncbi:MAG TPA: phosphodiester glycosidase family protein [Trichocoleus sp.]